MVGRLLFATLLICTLLSVCGRNMPAPLTSAAAPDRFRAAGAQTVVAELARAPHPVESQELARVRAFLYETLRSIGFSPEEQRGAIDGVQLTNLLVRIPGSAPSGTLLCLAHVDSVPRSPGAGDDSVGVSCWIEAFRALRAGGWTPKNDVLLLMSDGEERGLYGARLFISKHPLMQKVACVINLEAIGNGGPAVLFQLGEANGACVSAFAHCEAAPTGTSLGDAVYRRMPNDTDLTPFLERGIAGFNLAISSGSTAYHAAHDTPANLDPRSVQHMGECALSLAKYLAGIDLGSLRAADLTFFDVLGFEVVRYSRAWDLVLAILGCVLTWLACKSARASGAELVMHALRHLLGIALVAVGVALTWWLFDTGVSLVTPQLDWVAGNTTSGVLLFIGAIGISAGLELRQGRVRSDSSAARSCAIAIVWCIAALAALQWLPGASFVFTWPLILGALGTWRSLRTPEGSVSATILVLGFAGALVLGLPILELLLQLFLRAPLPALVLTSGTLASAAGLFAPHFQRIQRDVPWARKTFFGAGALALLASIVVARVFVWRQGSLLP